MSRRSMLPARAAAILLVAAAAGGCVATGNPLAGYSREQRAEMGRRVTITPAPVSTLEFKDLGDTRRYAAMRTLVRSAWQADCAPIDARVRGYSPNGDSQWQVRCAGSTLRYDYLVTIPERRASGARVLQCYSPDPRLTQCSVAGRPA